MFCKKSKLLHQSYLAFKEEFETLSRICFSSSVDTGWEGLKLEALNGISSDALPRDKPRALLASPKRVYFGVPNEIWSRDRYWCNGGTAGDDMTLPRITEPAITPSATMHRSEQI